MNTLRLRMSVSAVLSGKVGDVSRAIGKKKFYPITSMKIAIHLIGMNNMSLTQKLHLKACIDIEKLRSKLASNPNLTQEEVDMTVKSYSLTRQHGAICNN